MADPTEGAGDAEPGAGARVEGTKARGAPDDGASPYSLGQLKAMYDQSGLELKRHGRLYAWKMFVHLLIAAGLFICIPLYFTRPEWWYALVARKEGEFEDDDIEYEKARERLIEARTLLRSVIVTRMTLGEEG